MPFPQNVIMFECRWFKNLSNFATSRPPFVIFTLCLAIFAAGLFSIGYYVQSQGFEQNPVSLLLLVTLFDWRTLKILQPTKRKMTKT